MRLVCSAEHKRSTSFFISMCMLGYVRLSSSQLFVIHFQVPLAKPIAGVEVGLIDGSIVVNPTKQQMANSTLQLTMAGTKDGILMIEGFADFVTEEIFLSALAAGHEAIGIICDGITTFQKIVGKEKKTDTLRLIPKDLIEIMDKVPPYNMFY